MTVNRSVSTLMDHTYVPVQVATDSLQMDLVALVNYCR